MLSEPEIWISFSTLFLMELVLGVDNIIFISLLAGDLPPKDQKTGRMLGVLFALLLRIGFLTTINWIMTLDNPLFNAAEWFGVPSGEWHDRFDISPKDIILLTGGLFLIYKSNLDIYNTIEKSERKHKKKYAHLWSTVLQIGLLDIVLGIDSVITAVGMANSVGVMIAAVGFAMTLMLFAANTLGNFVNKHPSLKLMALAFLLLIGITLIAEGIDEQIPKGYIYFAMGFSMFFEILILRLVKTKKIRVNAS
jgi:predicted tellurium resistance membrane protein TerC